MGGSKNSAWSLARYNYTQPFGFATGDPVSIGLSNIPSVRDKIKDAQKVPGEKVKGFMNPELEGGDGSSSYEAPEYPEITIPPPPEYKTPIAPKPPAAPKATRKTSNMKQKKGALSSSIQTGASGMTKKATTKKKYLSGSA